MTPFWGDEMQKLMNLLDDNPTIMPGYGDMTLPQLHDALEKFTKANVSAVETPEAGAILYLDWFSENGYKDEVAAVRGKK